MRDALEPAQFSSAYSRLKALAAPLEEAPALLEMDLQERWHHAFFSDALQTREGHVLRILSTGWWNKLGGPDFTNAQLEFNGEIVTGDVEIHCRGRDWYEHGHHTDPAYDSVLLHVVPDLQRDDRPAVTASGRAIATLCWSGIDKETLAMRTAVGHPPERCGACSTALVARNPEAFREFLGLAGEWRILEKMRRIRDRLHRVGPDQALYEGVMGACGYSNFKEPFQRIARALPYERARQLAQQEAYALEAALFRLAGLLPEPWPHNTSPPDHYSRIQQIREDYLPGLAVLPLTWSRSGSRPANTPERRLAGAARLLMRTKDKGLHRQLDILWRLPMKPVERRRAFEACFGGATGFWANHYGWCNPPTTRSSAPLGAGRIRAIIGNVFIPAALAWARHNKDRTLEENVYNLFSALPPEPENRIHRTMATWVLGNAGAIRLGFQQQQGLLQMHEDWCANNPSCRNCTLLRHLDNLEQHQA